MSKAGEFSVSIKAQSPACFVWLVAKDVRGRFSENGFLLTEPSKTVCRNEISSTRLGLCPCYRDKQISQYQGILGDDYQ